MQCMYQIKMLCGKDILIRIYQMARIVQLILYMSLILQPLIFCIDMPVMIQCAASKPAIPPIATPETMGDHILTPLYQGDPEERLVEESLH